MRQFFLLLIMIVQFPLCAGEHQPVSLPKSILKIKNPESLQPGHAAPKSSERRVSFAQHVKVFSASEDKVEGAVEDGVSLLELNALHDGETSSDDDESDEQEDPFFIPGDDMSTDDMAKQRLVHYSRRVKGAFPEEIQHEIVYDHRTAAPAQSRQLGLVMKRSKAAAEALSRAPRIPPHLLLSSVHVQQEKARRRSLEN